MGHYSNGSIASPPKARCNTSLREPTTDGVGQTI
jgi:hypothetical protein